MVIVPLMFLEVFWGSEGFLGHVNLQQVPPCFTQKMETNLSVHSRLGSISQRWKGHLAIKKEICLYGQRTKFVSLAVLLSILLSALWQSVC